MSAPDLTRERPERPAQTAILDATERLLAARRFSELAVNDIIDAAGVSRTSFYAHFGSRTAVLAACLRRVVGEAGSPPTDPSDPADLADPSDPASVIRASLQRWVALAGAHGPLLRTASEEWPHDPELRDLWFATVAAYAQGSAEAIEHARRAGGAPPGADAQALAAVLMWGFERVLHVSLVGEATGLGEPSAIVEPLTQMMLGGAFGAVTQR